MTAVDRVRVWGREGMGPRLLRLRARVGADGAVVRLRPAVLDNGRVSALPWLRCGARGPFGFGRVMELADRAAAMPALLRARRRHFATPEYEEVVTFDIHPRDFPPERGIGKRAEPRLSVSKSRRGIGSSRDLFRASDSRGGGRETAPRTASAGVETS